MRPVGRRLSTASRLGAFLLASLVLTGCAEQPFTEQGRKVYTLYNFVLVLALVIGVGVIGMILLTCVRYRKQPGDETLPPQTHGNTTFEIIWTLIPTLIVLGLFAMSFSTIRAIDKPNQPFAASIEVRGYQWFWTFDYGTNAAGTRVLVRSSEAGKPPVMMVPVGERIHVEERSDNVLHSWFVPEFLFKRDAVPGHANGFDFTVTAPGVYKGQCAELCGTDHAEMTFEVKAVGRAEFDKWFGEFKPPQARCEETGKAATAVTITSPENETTFDQQCVYVTAGQPVKVTYRNGGGLQHNVAVYEGSLTAGGTLVKAGAIIPSGTDIFDVPALQPGKDYNFFCQVHPQMEGRWVVQ